MIPRFRSFLVLMAVMTLISGCGAVVEVQTGGSGTLSLSMTDASNDQFEAVYVTIDKIQIHLGGSESQ